MVVETRMSVLETFDSVNVYCVAWLLLRYFSIVSPARGETKTSLLTFVRYSSVVKGANIIPAKAQTCVN